MLPKKIHDGKGGVESCADEGAALAAGAEGAEQAEEEDESEEAEGAESRLSLSAFGKEMPNPVIMRAMTSSHFP